MDRLTKKLDRPDIPVVYTKGWFGDTVPEAMNQGGIRAILKRLCEYEDTGLTPEEIMEMKKTADIKKRQCIDVVDVPKIYDGTIIQRVSRKGVKINGEYFYDDSLVLNYLGQKVKIVINGNVAAVFDLGHKSEYPIAGFILETFNCKHTFHPYTNEENTKAKIFTQVVSRYGLQIDGKKYYLPDLVFSHLGYRVKIKIQGHMVDVYDFHNDNHLENFEL